MSLHRLILATVCALAAVIAARAEEVLPLDTAVQLALAHSKGAQLAQLKVEESGTEVRSARLQRYPRINVIGLAGRYYEPLDVKLKAGSLTPLLDGVGTGLGLGSLSTTLGQFPPSDLTLLQGERHQYLGGVSVLQPLTQQWRIGSGLAAAQAGRVAAQREADRTTVQIRSAVEQLFAGILLEQSRAQAHAARAAYLERRLRDAENARAVGEALDDIVLGARAELTQARAEGVRSKQERTKLVLQLADLIGRAGAEDISVSPELPQRPGQTLAHWLGRVAANPDRVVAEATAERALAGVRASRQARIPDLTLFASGYWQEGQALVPARGGVAGLALNWEIFDFGRRSSEISRSRILHRQAETNRDRLEEEAAREIRLAWQDYQYAGELITLAEQARDYRRRAAELARQSAANGLELPTKVLETEADLRKADSDWLGATLQRHVALLRLHALTGSL